MKPNILFLILDSFRANACFGTNRTSKTPTIDSLIRNGVLFNQAIACADGTLTALGSIFTANYPFKTGIRDKHVIKANSQISTYLKILKDYGYHIYAKFPEIYSTFSWIAEEFENSDKTYPVKHPEIFRLYDGLGQQIIKKLQSHTVKEPWFYFIHLLDTHPPFSVPKEYDNDQYGSTEYERTISITDLWLGKIFDNIDMKKTLLVLTSDHGEYITDESIPKVFHESKDTNFKPRLTKVRKEGRKFIPKSLQPLGKKLIHSYQDSVQRNRLKKFENLNLTPYQRRSIKTRAGSMLYDEVIHVPLIFSGYTIPSNIIVPQQVRQVDIFPTIAEIIQLSDSDIDTDGKSMVPFFSNENKKELPSYIESVPGSMNSLGEVIGIRTSKYKYLRNRDDSKKNVYLFDLKNDPLEDNNVANINTTIIKEMESILSSIKSKYLVKNEKDFIKRRILQKRDKLIFHK